MCTFVILLSLVFTDVSYLLYYTTLWLLRHADMNCLSHQLVA